MIDLLKRYFDQRRQAKIRLRQWSEHTRIDQSAVIMDAELDVRKPVSGRKYLEVGADSMINGRFVFESEEGRVSCGERVFLGYSNYISRSHIEFESDIFVAWGCYFYDHDSHAIDHRQRRLDMKRQLEDHRTGKPNFIYSKDWSQVKSRPIKVCKDAWVGMNSTVLKGVTIGEGAIVGAGSVVTSDVPDWTMVAGNPATVIRRIDPKSLEA